MAQNNLNASNITSFVSSNNSIVENNPELFLKTPKQVLKEEK